MLAQRGRAVARINPQAPGGLRGGRAGWVQPPPHARITLRPTPTAISPMDIEQVNAIGTLLADLSARTEQLRGYL